VQILALDFDGVISDSAGEAFRVALRTWRTLRPETPLSDGCEEDPELYRRFLAAMPLGNRAEDYGVILAALEEGVSLDDQCAYDAFYRRQDAEQLRAFHRRFYRERSAWAERDPGGWLKLMGPYPGICPLLRRHAHEVRLAIATAKYRRSVRRLLEVYGIGDLFGEDAVLDKETGVHKSSHMEHLARIWKVPYREITFIDDKVNHLEEVARLGIRCVLAAWGYNGEREHRAARAAGHLVCTLEDLEDQLFGG